jgi:formylglycine-generating enzyme required for sulfatase activity
MSSRRILLAFFLVVAALTTNSAWAEPPKPKDGPLGMKFMPLPKATFFMGWDGEEKGKKTEIKEDFEIAVHTVTQGQWREVMGYNPSSFSRDGIRKDSVKDISDSDLNQFPVECVSWDDAQEFIKKLNEKERGKGWSYRLPTSAEWEYACRGGATSEEECSFHFYFDKPTNDLSSEQANFNGDSPFGKAPKGKYEGRPTRVGAYTANKLGVYDMHGNVYQWCVDAFGEKTSERVCRGGSWGSRGSDCTAGRSPGLPRSGRHDNFGFRLARVPAR